MILKGLSKNKVYNLWNLKNNLNDKKILLKAIGKVEFLNISFWCKLFSHKSLNKKPKKISSILNMPKKKIIAYRTCILIENDFFLIKKKVSSADFKVHLID